MVSAVTLEAYMLGYTAAPIAKHLSKKEGEATDSLGKWFPKATVVKSSVCYSNDYLVALKKKQNIKDSNDSNNEHSMREPKASLVLFYQYVNPTWTPSKVSAFLQYITQIVKSHRTNLGGRMRISTEGVNCTVSAASTSDSTNPTFEAAQTLRHFAQDLRNFDYNAFKDTDFKYVDGLSADRHFKEMKILPVKELVFYGIREEGNGDVESRQEDCVTTKKDVEDKKNGAVLPKNARGGIHLDPKEYHEMLKNNNAVVIDVRNHYEAAIGRFDGQMEQGGNDDNKLDHGDHSGGESKRETAGAQYIDPKMRKSTDFTSWLEDPETKQKLEGKAVMMFCTGGIRCERASAYLNAQMGSNVNGVYQLRGGIERYLQAFPDGGFWRGKNFVFDKREAISAGNVNGDGGVIRKEGSKRNAKDGSSSVDNNKLLSWGTECAKCKRPWDRYVGKRKCYTCGVPILVCDECMSHSCTHKKNKKRKNNHQNGESKDTEQADIETSDDYNVRCPLCIEEGVTVPAEEVEYTDNGVRSKQRSNSFSEGGEVSNTSCMWQAADRPEHEVSDKTNGNCGKAAREASDKKAAKSLLKWGGGHAAKKKEKRRYSRKLCQFGVDCVRKDCFFYHPVKNESKK